MARVLIADDEEQILGVMVDVLENAGYEVVAVKDGSEALKAAEKTNFDVALLDVMMPKIDGYHLALKLNALPKPPKIAIITSRNYETDKQTLQTVGVAAYLPKPFSNHELVDIVSTLVHLKRRTDKDL